MSNPYSPQPQQPDFSGQQPVAPAPQNAQFGYQQPFPQNGMPANQVANYPAGYAPVGYAPKSKIAAALLAFFLGTLGLHNFYLGYKTKAFWQLGLTIAGFITSLILIGVFILFGVAIWAFVEFIMILAGAESYKRDANGVPLSS